MNYLAVVDEVEDERIWVCVVSPEHKPDENPACYRFNEHDLLCIEPSKRYPIGFWKHWEGFTVTIDGRLDLADGLSIERVYTFE